MCSMKKKNVEDLRNAIPTPPANGDELKHLAVAVRKALVGTPIESRTDEILANYVKNQAKTGHDFDSIDAGYLNGVADYIESSMLDDFSDLDEQTFDWFMIGLASAHPSPP